MKTNCHDGLKQIAYLCAISAEELIGKLKIAAHTSNVWLGCASQARGAGGSWQL